MSNPPTAHTAHFTDADGTVISVVGANKIQQSADGYLTRLMKLRTANDRTYFVAQRFVNLQQYVVENSQPPHVSISIMKQKNDNMEYGDMAQLKDDVMLMVRNWKDAYQSTQKDPADEKYYLNITEGLKSKHLAWIDAERVRKNCSEYFSLRAKNKNKAATDANPSSSSSHPALNNNPPSHGSRSYFAPPGKAEAVDSGMVVINQPLDLAAVYEFKWFNKKFDKKNAVVPKTTTANEATPASEQASTNEPAPAKAPSAEPVSAPEEIMKDASPAAEGTKRKREEASSEQKPEAVEETESAAKVMPPVPDHVDKALCPPFLGKSFQAAQELLVTDLKNATDKDGLLVTKVFMSLPSRSLKDYYKAIDKPMSINGFEKKVNGYQGKSAPATGVSDLGNWDSFLDTVSLIWRNAYQYNEEKSEIVQEAKALEAYFIPRFEAAKAVVAEPNVKLRLNVQTPQQPKLKIRLGGASQSTENAGERLVYPPVNPVRQSVEAEASITAKAAEHLDPMELDEEDRPDANVALPGIEEPQQLNCQQDFFDNPNQRNHVPGLTNAARFPWKGAADALWSEIQIEVYYNGIANDMSFYFPIKPDEALCNVFKSFSLPVKDTIPAITIKVWPNAQAIGHRALYAIMSLPYRPIPEGQPVPENFPADRVDGEANAGGSNEVPKLLEWDMQLMPGQDEFYLEFFCTSFDDEAPLVRGNERELECLTVSLYSETN